MEGVYTDNYRYVRNGRPRGGLERANGTGMCKGTRGHGRGGRPKT